MKKGEFGRGGELGSGGKERGMGLRVRVLVKRRAWSGESVRKRSCRLMCKMMASWQNTQTWGLKIAQCIRMLTCTNTAVQE